MEAKRFLVFTYDEYYAIGADMDFVDSYNSIDDIPEEYSEYELTHINPKYLENIVVFDCTDSKWIVLKGEGCYGNQFEDKSRYKTKNDVYSAEIKSLENWIRTSIGTIESIEFTDKWEKGVNSELRKQQIIKEHSFIKENKEKIKELKKKIIETLSDFNR